MWLAGLMALGLDDVGDPSPSVPGIRSELRLTSLVTCVIAITGDKGTVIEG